MNKVTNFLVISLLVVSGVGRQGKLAQALPKIDSSNELNLITPHDSAKQQQKVKAAPKINQTEKRKVETLIKQSFQYLNKENFQGYMNTISKKSPDYSMTTQLVPWSFKQYDLRYEINKIEFLEVSSNQARVRLTQTTKKIKGAAFRNNRAIAIHYLRKDNNQWKFYSSKPESIVFLN